MPELPLAHQVPVERKRTPWFRAVIGGVVEATGEGERGGGVTAGDGGEEGRGPAGDADA